MEPRAQRQALRQYLNSAREALEQGDRAAAHAAVDAALALDPHYLAAQALKEQIDRWPAAARVARLHERIPSDAFSHRGRHGDPADGSEATESPQETDSLPAVSPEGWMRFEHRARTRRLERRVEAARTAIGRRRFAEARAVIEEIRQIDDGHPDLISLWIELDAAVHMSRSVTPLWRRALVASVVIGGVWLGVRYADRVVNRTHGAVASSPLREAPVGPPVGDGLRPPEQPVAQPPTPTPAAAPELPRASVPPASTSPADTRAPQDTPGRLPETPRPAPAPSSALKAPIARAPEVQVPPVPREPGALGTSARGTTGTASDVAPPSAPPQPAALVPAVSPVTLPSTPPIERPAVQTADTFGTGAPPAEPAASRALVSAAIITPRADEELVRSTLQQYRAAYESLDAHSAQAVWPSVDAAALSRAFSGLQSQRLMFDDCQVQVRGAVGHATCRGTAVYVPRVGSRDPHREPRVWTFDLRKIGENWQIDRARAER